MSAGLGRSLRTAPGARPARSVVAGTRSGTGDLPVITSIQAGDLTEVVAFMRRFPEVHFCDWETEEVIGNAVAAAPGVNLVARVDGRIVGALLAGVVGMRGTVNHLATDPLWRRGGLASALVRRAMAGFREVGIRRVFLFVEADCGGSLAFWRRMGFQETSGEVTLERDL